MRISILASLFGRTPSIVLPITPPRTPEVDELRGSTWKKATSMERQTDINLEDEKSQPLELPSMLYTRDNEWITYEDIAKMGKLPYLVGLRAAASIAIQLFHVVRPGTRGASYFGCCGLSILFVQGAFLVTGSLIQLQKANQGKSIFKQHAHLPRFFINRAVRLYPALLVMIVITSTWWQLRYNRPLQLAKAIFRALFKIQHTRFLHIPDKPANPFAHTWFLDVQEVFYLLLALALPFLVALRSRSRSIILLSLFIFSFHRRSRESVFNAALSINTYRMIAGVALQLIPIPRSVLGPKMRRLAVISVILGSLWGFSTYFNHNYSLKMQRIHGDSVGVIISLLVTLASLSTKVQSTDSLLSPSYVSVGVQEKGRPAAPARFTPLDVLNAKWLEFVGRISYSWYLWQVPVMHFETTFMSGYKSLGSTCEAFILAMISTFLFEEPIRDWYRARLKRTKLATINAS
jgi:peptidoglycan/LPS O-acetylase OafA/YrhL